MKNFLFFIGFALLNLPLFAQTSSIAFSEKEMPKTLFSENYNGNTTANSLFSTKGEPWEKGFFIDLIWGAGSETTSRPAVPNIPGSIVSGRTISQTSLRLGSKWYFGSGEKFRPGIQGVWARIGVITPFVGVITGAAAASFTTTTLTAALLNVGSTNLFIFSDKIGLEANFNIGMNSSFSFNSTSNGGNQTVMQFGVLLNPVVKFRYKKFAVGVDVAYSYYPAPGQVFESAKSAVPYIYETSIIAVGLTIGLKL